MAGLGRFSVIQVIVVLNAEDEALLLSAAAPKTIFIVQGNVAARTLICHGFS